MAAGGIAGAFDGTMETCIGDVDIDVSEGDRTGFGGGLIGLISSLGSTVQNCYSLGDVSVASGPAGGLIGTAAGTGQSGTVSESLLLRERESAVADDQSNIIRNSYAVGEIAGEAPPLPGPEEESGEWSSGLAGAVGIFVVLATETETPSPSEESDPDLFTENVEGLETDDMQGDSPDSGGTMAFDFDTIWQTVVTGESVGNPVANEDGYQF